MFRILYDILFFLVWFNVRELYNTKILVIIVIVLLHNNNLFYNFKLLCIFQISQ